MCESTITVICFYNGKTLKTKIDVKYVRNKAVIVHFDVPVDSTFEQYIIYDILKDRH